MVKIRHMANTFRKIYKKTGSSGTSSDYELTGVVGVNGVELDIMKGATLESDGEIGLVPKPPKLESEEEGNTEGWKSRFLSSVGEWIIPPAFETLYKYLYVNDINTMTTLENVDDKKLISGGVWTGDSYHSFIINMSVIDTDSWRHILQFHFWLQGNAVRLDIRARFWGTWTDWVKIV